MKIDESYQTTVYPDPKGISLHTYLEQQESYYGEEKEFEGLRQYDGTQRVSSIHWPSVAKGDMSVKEFSKESAIQSALKAGDYIIQPLIRLDLWTEEFPWIDREKKKLFLKRWQTDFRCFVTDKGLIGFVTRFGGIPTNVGSGGGVQCTAILRDRMPYNQAVRTINEAILHLGFDFIPDIAVFSKGMSNGFPMASVIGSLHIMESAQNTFISSTYWTDRIGPTAALSSIKKK